MSNPHLGNACASFQIAQGKGESICISGGRDPQVALLLLLSSQERELIWAGLMLTIPQNIHCMYTLKCSPFRAIWPFTNLPMAMKINCNANYAKKKNQRVRVKLMSAEFLICACGHLVLLSLGTVTFLSSLCWCFIPLPLWLSHWHLNAAFWLLTPFSFFPLYFSLYRSVLEQKSPSQQRIC